MDQFKMNAGRKGQTYLNAQGDEVESTKVVEVSSNLLTVARLDGKFITITQRRIDDGEYNFNRVMIAKELFNW